MSEESERILDGAIAPARNTKMFGHEDAERFLAQSYRSGKGHHAILIEGPEGIGKATLAYRFANHILTHPEPENAPDHISDPDPDSPVSRQLASGASHNLLHLERPYDEKSGRFKTAITVDEVRRAGKFFAQTSGSGNWRIIILDPADDLNRSAANAILKILEEPPKRALFLVLSHAPGKLLPTIRSRCLSLRLSPLDDLALQKALDHLSVRVEPGSAGSLLAAAKGSVSEALKLLNYGGGEIISAYQDVLAQKGPAARQAMHRLADALSQKGADTIYTFFTAHIGTELMERARHAAHSGDLVAAERYATLTSAVNEQLTVANAYNLDRKQTIISVLEAISQ
jgi:DNA polymerase III subunit delta'